MAKFKEGARSALMQAFTGNADLIFDMASANVELWISTAGSGLPFSQSLNPSDWQIQAGGVDDGYSVYVADINFGAATELTLVGQDFRLSYNGLDLLEGKFPQEYTINAGDIFSIPANTLVITW